MYIDSKLQSAVRLALGVSAGALAVSASPGALAQEGAGDLEEITVTGSRIKRADLDSASPVTVLDREVILAQGITDVGNLIQRMPSMSGSPIGTTTNNGGNGSVQIDLRGMGVDRTLTLVNGMRTVDAGDYQTIPANMIERVEILKDGASAVYGADAVAGVVNIITRRDFEGLEFTAQTADWFDTNSGAQNAIGLIAGKQFDAGNFVFGAEYVDQEEAYQSDTPWAFMQNSYYIGQNWGVPNEGCENNPTATPVPPGCFAYGSSRIPETRVSWFSQGTQLIGTPATTPYEVGVLQAHDNRTYNYAPVNYIQTPYKRTNIFAEAHFDVLENVRFNTMVRSNYRESSQELAPLPYTGGDPYHNGFYLNPANNTLTPYEGVSENSYYLRRAVDTYNRANPNATQLIYEPVVQPRRRMIETTRRFEQGINQYQVMMGFEGTFNEVDWEVFYNTGKRSRTDVDFGQFSGARLHNALGPSADLNGDGQPECYGKPGNDPGGVNASTLINSCVPLNLFGGGVVDPVTSKPTTTTVTQDMIDYVSADLVDTYVTTVDTAGLVFSGEVFELNGGPMGWAVGYGYWGQTYTYSPDSGKQTGAVTGNVGAGTAGSLYNNAVYGEVFLPFWDNGRQALDVKIGARYDDWNAFDGKGTGQIGVEFQAIESLKFRATGGTVFRAPTINNLFGGRVDSFPTYTDPCIPSGGAALPPGCAQTGVQLDSQLRARVGGNPELQPETGTTFTGGVVWNPEFGDSDLSVTLDYWQVDIEDGISSLGVQYTLDQCYINQDAASCAKITRNADYSINQVLDGDINVADQGARGVDTEVRWSMDSGIGQWQAAVLWSHLLERTKTQQPGVPEQDLSGRFTDDTAEDGGGYPTDKVNFSLQWFRNDFSVGYLGEYISGIDADTFCNCGTGNQPDGTYRQKVDSLLYHDLVANYMFESTGTNIAAGVTNLTDEAPPYIEIGFNGGTSPQIYRMFGRGYYLRLTQTFE
jgi:outer membrane receptor protein involved in Fe transport